MQIYTSIYNYIYIYIYIIFVSMYVPRSIVCVSNYMYIYVSLIASVSDLTECPTHVLHLAQVAADRGTSTRRFKATPGKAQSPRKRKDQSEGESHFQERTKGDNKNDFFFKSIFGSVTQMLLFVQL